jgi:hypothetical protein
MKKSRDLDNILNECLERLIRGESIEACLSRHPEHAAALEPLLRMALDTLRAADIRPRPEFRQRAAAQFQAAIREMPVKERRGFFAVLKPGLATIIIVVVVLLAGGGTVAAAAGSLPDSPLYPVKLATESVRLALTPSALGKAELNARFADERVDEIIEMAEKGKAELIEKATERMNKQLVAVANLSITGGEEKAGHGEEAAVFDEMSEVEQQAPKALMAPVPAAAPSPTAIPAATPPATTTPTTTSPAVDAPPPPVVIMTAPSPEVDEAQPEGLVSRTYGLDSGQKPDKQQKLKQDLSKQALENLQALQEELEKAPENLKPVLQRAIEVAEEAYREALANLGE